ncbi:MAG TPA: hypothetical protein VGN90_03275 [Pyrinomonadaceae bacterium]|jgi:hypothetical protein|nr:hypothetical protein [Pyrinomonadaceae bacterium]
MEPTMTLILAALAFGAREVASETIKDSYEALKAMIKKRFASVPEAETALALYEKDPDAGEAQLKRLLSETGASSDAEIIEASRSLLIHVNPQQAASGKYNVQITGNVQAYVQGDDANVTMNFTGRPEKD